MVFSRLLNQLSLLFEKGAGRDGKNNGSISASPHEGGGISDRSLPVFGGEHKIRVRWSLRELSKIPAKKTTSLKREADPSPERFIRGPT